LRVAKRRPRGDSQLYFRDRFSGQSGNARHALCGVRPCARTGARDSVTDKPRIALFADTFYEVNGAARTFREWDQFARRRGLPFLCIRWGPRAAVSESGPVWSMELVRSRLAFPIDPDLFFDMRVCRFLGAVEAQVRRFQPDFIHIISPGDLGILGAIIAWRCGIPLAASWHTNLHEFAARRAGVHGRLAGVVERFVMNRVCWFFGRAQVLFAPNPELAGILQDRTGRPVMRMGRGIDTELFHPTFRSRTDSELVLSYVGRLMPEKNLRLLPRVAA